jgi:hypothetical protein
MLSKCDQQLCYNSNLNEDGRLWKVVVLCPFQKYKPLYEKGALWCLWMRLQIAIYFSKCTS